MKKGSKMQPGTYAVGSQRYNAKLTEVDIPIVRDYLKSKKSLQWIAMKFGVNKSIIHRISHGKGWAHV